MPGGGGWVRLGTITATPNDISKLYLDCPLQWEERKIWLATNNIWMKHTRHLKGCETQEERATVFAKTLSAAGNMSSEDGRPTLADFVVYCREHIEEDERQREVEATIAKENGQGSATSLSQDHDLLEPFDFPIIPLDLDAQGESRYMRDAIARRAFIIVVGLRMGLGPHSVCVGDIVCLLYGGKTPFVLRKVVEESKSQIPPHLVCMAQGIDLLSRKKS